MCGHVRCNWLSNKRQLGFSRLTSLSLSLSSASVSFTLLTNICRISSSLRCRSPKNSFLLASYVSWRLQSSKARTENRNKERLGSLQKIIVSFHCCWQLVDCVSLSINALSVLHWVCPPSTWMARCQDLYLWNPSPRACSAGTAHNGGHVSAPSDPPCWLWSASLWALQSRSGSRSQLKGQIQNAMSTAAETQEALLVIPSTLDSSGVQIMLFSVLASRLYSVPGHHFQMTLTCHLSLPQPLFLLKAGMWSLHRKQIIRHVHIRHPEWLN